MWVVRDCEGRVYGYYSDRSMADDAAASASRGYPWRSIRVEATKGRHV